MAKDPAFLFYPGDFNTGTQFFSDEQVGKYMRLLMAQHQHGHLSENQMIFICKSYDKDIFSKFKKDSDGNWFNERLEIEVEKRKSYVKSRSKNKEGKGKKKIISSSYVPHMENENEIENKDYKYSYKESDKEQLEQYDQWTEDIIGGNDQFFEQMFMKEMIPAGDHIQFWIMDHRDLLNRYPKMRPPTQGAFRKSCIKHIRENYKKPINGNGKGKSGFDAQTTLDRLNSYGK
jgi:uncharacterized protein YdaU (DUF1376 family)